MFLQVFKIDPFKSGAVGGFEIDGRGDAGIKGLLPAGDAEAPFVPGFQTGKTVGWYRSGQVVAGCLGEFEELTGQHDTDGMEAAIFWAGAAETVAIETGHRFLAATLEFSSEDVGYHGGDGAALGLLIL